MFVTFEGAEGSGKSTQIRMLANYFRTLGLDPLVVRNPGSTDLGEEVRRLVLADAGPHMHARTETYLHAAAIHEAVSQLIGPALASGRTILCDRFTDSALAYQGIARGAGAEFVRTVVHQQAAAHLVPDLTFLLDLPAEWVPARTNQKRQSQEGRIEREAQAFHAAVRLAYLDIAQQEPQRVVVIDATLREEEVFDVIVRRFATESRPVQV